MSDERPDPTISVHREDKAMSAAIEAARSSLGKFIEAFLRPTAKQLSFLLKVRFEREGKVEHLARRP